MTTIIGGVFAVVAMILGQIVTYHVVMATVPQYITMWIIAVVFAWVSLIFKAIGEA